MLSFWIESRKFNHIDPSCKNFLATLQSNGIVTERKKGEVFFSLKICWIFGRGDFFTHLKDFWKSSRRKNYPTTFFCCSFETLYFLPVVSFYNTCVSTWIHVKKYLLHLKCRTRSLAEMAQDVKLIATLSWYTSHLEHIHSSSDWWLFGLLFVFYLIRIFTINKSHKLGSPITKNSFLISFQVARLKKSVSIKI